MHSYVARLQLLSITVHKYPSVIPSQQVLPFVSHLFGLLEKYMRNFHEISNMYIDKKINLQLKDGFYTV